MQNSFSHQDWKPVVFKKKIEKKQPSTNKKPIIPEDGTEMKRKVITPALKSAIMNARIAKKWKQVDLANRLGVPVKTVNEYESGKAIPNNGTSFRSEITKSSYTKG